MTVMQLFTPDIFSVSNISYRDIPLSTQTLIARTIQENYSLLCLDVIEMRQLSALELNSNNFSISTRTGDRFLLKRIAINTTLDTLEFQYQVSDILRRTGVSMPIVFQNDKGNLISLDEMQERWTLSKFIEGGYYTGDEDTLIEVGTQFGNIIKILNNRDTSKLPINAAVGEIDAFESSFKRFINSKNEWAAFYTKPIASFLLDQEIKLVKTGNFILEDLHKLKSLPMAAAHTDLHPHNVLVKDGRLKAFVDVDSLQVNIRSISIAFAVYKLVRQHAVNAHLSVSDTARIRNSARTFLHSITEVVEISDVELESLQFAALYEIYRRVLIISNLNILNRNSMWNKVLPMHLIALHEIPIIFE
jgi:Ser/Thr protein kinase RdoA (MazF antagonist)